MKTSKRLLSLILCVLLAVSLLMLPASAENTDKEDAYPFVFVHGLMGWGERSSLDPILPYWGMTTGSLMDYLNSKGYESYAAQVGPLSGAWDRACELYAQLTGTRVDYGAAHSVEKGHDRYGITYSEPLFEGWSAEKKVNLIGHSFGGATIRMFLEILADGAPEEVAAAKAAGTEPSPFFEGGRGDWVYSLTAVAAPHNGTTFIESADTSTKVVTDLVYNIGATLGMGNLKGVYDLQLEHFGISEQSGETDLEYISRVLGSEDFMSHNDNAIYDLTIDNALVINDGIDLQENVYYFSVCGDATRTTALGTEVPEASVFALLKPYATIMGSYYDKSTAGGVYIDKSWLPNDGMVNVVSGLYPFDSSMQCLKNDGSRGYVMCAGGSETYEKGVWNVMPTKPYDHLSIIGGIFSNTVSATHSLYVELLERIRSTYGSDNSPINDELPFSDVSKDSWSYKYILEMYRLGVVNGRGNNIFAPYDSVTRSEFVKMLACLNGADVSGISSCRFSDVGADDMLAPYIEWAAENGIVKGYGDGRFGPADSISREQIAAILCRYADYAGIKLGDSEPMIAFTDANDISAYARDNVSTLVRAGVIDGIPNGDGSYSFRPHENASREQACKLLAMI